MAYGTCSVNTCDRFGKLIKTWCPAHFVRWKRHGDVLAHIPLRPAPPAGTRCSVPTCDEPFYALSYCQTHRARFRKYGDPLADVPIRKAVPVDATCAVDDCRRTVEARGWCCKHYMRWYKHGDPTVNLYAPKPPRQCDVEDCGNAVQSLGWCRTHYSRWQCWGDVRADVPVRPRWTADDVCVVEACREGVKARGRCKKHYAKLLNEEIFDDPERRRRYLAYHRRWAARAKARDPERFRAQVRAWRSRNPFAARLLDARKRQRRGSAPTIRFTAAQLAERMRYWGNRCWICRGPFEAVDHVKPLAKGGWHALANLRPACKACNSSKKDKWPFPVRTATV